ncbi:MAG: hypothetical protein LBH43_18985 [Treponema sp.]|jgi:uncharacterized integral membrane protein|nr:hypothetical protein [Treponema sp.]
MRRLIGFILLFGLFLIFIVLNLDNKSGISFGFKTFNEVPVYLSIFLSFAAGMIFALFIVLYNRNRKKSRQEDGNPRDENLRDGNPRDENPRELNPKPSRKKGTRTGNSGSFQPERMRDQDNSYGID